MILMGGFSKIAHNPMCRTPLKIWALVLEDYMEDELFRKSSQNCGLINSFANSGHIFFNVTFSANLLGRSLNSIFFPKSFYN